MTRRAGMYLRQSLDRTGEGMAVDRQRAGAKRLATKHGWKVVEEYIDNDTSASGRKPRPAYRRLLTDVQAGKIDAIVAWAPDRLTRRPIEIEELVDLVEATGCLLATVAGEVDLSTPYGRAVARIFGAIARQEVEQKGARQVLANVQRAEQGKTPFTRRPFGYSLDGKAVDESEAAEIRGAADAALDGASLASIARDLNDRGVRTSTGGRWTVTSVRRVLLNPRNAGLATYKGKVTRPAAWPAIFSTETHDRLVRTLTNPARRTQAGTGHKYLLSGLVRCGRCGDGLDVPMFASPMGVKGNYYMVYKCRTAHLVRRLDLVDEVVVGAVVARLSQPDAIDLLAPAASVDDLPALRDEARHLHQQLDELPLLFAEGAITATGLREASARLRARLADVDARLLPATDAARVLEPLVRADDVRGVWEGLPLRHQRAVVDLLLIATVLPAGKGARFAPDQVRIAWR